MQIITASKTNDQMKKLLIQTASLFLERNTSFIRETSMHIIPSISQNSFAHNWQANK